LWQGARRTRLEARRLLLSLDAADAVDTSKALPSSDASFCSGSSDMDTMGGNDARARGASFVGEGWRALSGSGWSVRTSDTRRSLDIVLEVRRASPKIGRNV
jgi:hypothetical protein